MCPKKIIIIELNDDDDAAQIISDLGIQEAQKVPLPEGRAISCMNCDFSRYYATREKAKNGMRGKIGSCEGHPNKIQGNPLTEGCFPTHKHEYPELFNE